MPFDNKPEDSNRKPVRKTGANKELENTQKINIKGLQKPERPVRRAGINDKKETEQLDHLQMNKIVPQEPRRKKKSFLRKIVKGIGDLLYSLGFFAECKVVQVGRLIRNGVMFVAQIVSWAFGSTFKKLWQLFKGVCRDFAAPFVRFFTGIKNMRVFAKEQREKGTKGVHGEVVRYFGRGVKAYGHLLLNLLRLLLPIGAAALLAFTVYSIMHLEYGLAVEINGNLVGYAENETVVDDAQNMLRMRIRLDENQTLDEIDLTPTIAIAPTTKTLTKSELADGLLRNSSDKVMEARGIYMGEELIGVTTEGDRLEEMLDAALAEYILPGEEDNPNITVSFVDLHLNEEDEVFLTNTIKPYEDLEKMLTSNESEAVYYTAQGNESLEEIAEDHEITFEQLIARNPVYADSSERVEPDEGAVLTIRPAVPAYMRVQKIETIEKEEEIPFDTIYEEDDTVSTRVITTRQKGETGLRLAVYNNVYIDGELVRSELQEDRTQVVKEPVDQIIVKGTQVAGALWGGGEGTAYVENGYIWPVPDANASSRGFQSYHPALDINGPVGSPILASNAGTVITAGWHGSYGNYVVIDHHDGVKTLYAHNTELFVQAGDEVLRGQYIAALGSTGNSTGPHCHFEVIVNGVQVNPLGYVIPNIPLSYAPEVPWSAG